MRLAPTPWFGYWPESSVLGSRQLICWFTRYCHGPCVTAVQLLHCQHMQNRRQGYCCRRSLRARPFQMARPRQLTLPPSEYFKRQCYLALDADEEPAVDVVEKLGADYFVVSTDYPHPDGAFPEA